MAQSAGTDLYQIKGARYALAELLCDDDLVEAHRNGRYVTLRLTSSMYHRFHAPHDCRVEHVTYIPGDTWNVNPAALRRVEKLYCKNERAMLRTRLVRDAVTPSLWFRSAPCSSPAFACISSMSNCCLRTAGRNGIACNAEFRKARKWDGSSTARPSSCSRRTASHSATTSGKAP